MPSLRFSDGSPPAAQCHTCGTTHRKDRSCPPVNRWLVSGQPVKGLPEKPISKEVKAA